MRREYTISNLFKEQLFNDLWEITNETKKQLYELIYEFDLELYNLNFMPTVMPREWYYTFTSEDKVYPKVNPEIPIYRNSKSTYPGLTTLGQDAFITPQDKRLIFEVQKVMDNFRIGMESLPIIQLPYFGGALLKLVFTGGHCAYAFNDLYKTFHDYEEFLETVPTKL